MAGNRQFFNAYMLLLGSAIISGSSDCPPARRRLVLSRFGECFIAYHKYLKSDHCSSHYQCSNVVARSPVLFCIIDTNEIFIICIISYEEENARCTLIIIIIIIIYFLLNLKLSSS